MIDDFADKDAEGKSQEPCYAAAFVFFSGRVSGKNMHRMAQCQALVERVKEFKEINMDFNIYEENIFHLNLYRSLALYNSDLRQI